MSKIYRLGILAAVLAAIALVAACNMLPSPDHEGAASNRAATLTTIQGESQTWTTSSGDSVTASSSTLRMNADATGDTFSFASTVPAGTYAVTLNYKQRNLYGIFTLKINGAQVGSAVDSYNSSTSDVSVAGNLGNVTLPSTASTFLFTITGKNSSATDYDVKIDNIVLTPTTGATATPAVTATPTKTPTATPVGATATPTPAKTATPTPTKTPTPAPTATPGVTSTPTATGTQIVVAKSGGNYTTLSAALASIPSGNSSPKVILVKNGTYNEINHISGKSFITIVGESRTGTIISATNNESLHSGTTNRAVLSFESGTDFNLQNLTIKNTTTAGGSSKQAEAFSAKSASRVTLRQVNLVSWEDTLQFSGGTAYVEDSYIEGQIDFNWGTGVVYYNRCELRTNASNGYLFQPRNTSGKYGFVIVDSKLTANSGVASASSVLARPMGYADGQVAYINCQMGPHIKPAGWQTDSLSTLRYTEYQSKDLNGNTLDVSQRIAPSRQLSASEAATMRSVTTVLGGWNPGVH